MSVSKLKTEVLPAAFSRDGVTFVECSLDSTYKGGDQFQSNVVFVTATVVERGNKKEIPLVVKFEPFNIELRKELNSAVQFHNECLIYSKFIPLFNKNITEQICPNFYYGVSTLSFPEDDVIVIGDLRPQGYKMTEQRVILDYEHLKLAMKKLGNFHALSYIAKARQPDEFYNIVNKLLEPTWIDDNASLCHTIKRCFHRAMDPLIALERHSLILEKLFYRIDQSLVNLLLELVRPEEPFSVLCHGDFNRNNMLFKYNQNGEPEDVKFFDVATARYASPAIDIAFFLFMNSTREVRSAHWDDLLTAYHNSLTASLGDLEGPSRQQLQEQLKLKGFYGFVHTAFFLPLMLFESDFNINDTINLPPEEVAIKLAQVGGEEGTKMMMDQVEELVVGGFLSLDHPFLKP